jgi:hypothetical protein
MNPVWAMPLPSGRIFGVPRHGLLRPACYAGGVIDGLARPTEGCKSLMDCGESPRSERSAPAGQEGPAPDQRSGGKRREGVLPVSHSR